MSEKMRRQMLLIDKDPAVGRQLERWLGASGLDVVQVPNALAAIPRLRHASTAMIMVALEPTDMSDLVALARIRELPSGRDVRIVALSRATGTFLGRLQRLVSQLRIEGFVPKPLQQQAVLDAIGEVVSRAESTVLPAAPAPAPVTHEEVERVYLALPAQTHFERLGLPEGAGPEAIRAAFLEKVSRYRPHHVHLDTAEEQRMLRGIYDGLREAMKVLGSPDLRDAYGKELARRRKEQEELREPPPPPAPERATLRDPPVQRPAAEPAARPTSRRDAPKVPITRAPSIPVAREADAPVAKAPSVPVARTPGIPAAKAPPPRQELPPSQVTTEQPGDDLWTRTVKRERSDAENLAATARVQAVLGDFPGAVDLLRKAVQLEPDNTEIQYMLELNLGRKLKSLGRPNEARKHFELAVELSPKGNMVARDELAAVQVRSPSPKPSDEKSRLRDLFGGWGKKK